jgi:hypothetical protein
MERRKLLQSGAMGALALISLKAQSMTKDMIPSAELTLKVTISRNHGHDFAILKLDEIIKLARKIDAEGSSTLSIKGRSRHPHNVEIDSKNVMDLILGKVVELESTLDAGHTHTVTLSLS